MRRLSFYSGALGLVTLVLVGCGGGDEDGDTTAPVAPATEAPAALSKEELIAQGDAICAEVNAAVGTVASTAGAEGQAAQVADLYTGMVGRLQDLGASGEDAAGYDEFLAAAEGLAQAEGDVQLAAERGEEEGLATAQSEASAALASFQSAATSYGFEQCGEEPSAPVSGAPVEPGAEEPTEGLEEEAAPEVEEEAAPETGGAGSGEEGAGGGASAGGGTEGGGEGSGGEEGSGGIGPG